jgi:hypothetical protein
MKLLLVRNLYVGELKKAEGPQDFFLKWVWQKEFLLTNSHLNSLRIFTNSPRVLDPYIEI